MGVAGQDSKRQTMEDSLATRQVSKEKQQD